MGFKHGGGTHRVVLGSNDLRYLHGRFGEEFVTCLLGAPTTGVLSGSLLSAGLDGYRTSSFLDVVNSPNSLVCWEPIVVRRVDAFPP